MKKFFTLKKNHFWSLKCVPRCQKISNALLVIFNSKWFRDFSERVLTSLEGCWHKLTAVRSHYGGSEWQQDSRRGFVWSLWLLKKPAPSSWRLWFVRGCFCKIERHLDFSSHIQLKTSCVHASRVLWGVIVIFSLAWIKRAQSIVRNDSCPLILLHCFLWKIS